MWPEDFLIDNYEDLEKLNNKEDEKIDKFINMMAEFDSKKADEENNTESVLSSENNDEIPDLSTVSRNLNNSIEYKKQKIKRYKSKQ